MPEVTLPKPASPISNDGKILTCQRCGKSWARKYPDHLPKACSKCGSRYWQKPLTPYWANFRKEQAATREAPENPHKPTKYTGRIMYPDSLRVYYHQDAAILEPIKDICTHWLPEKMDPKPSLSSLYRLNNTVATTRKTALTVLKSQMNPNWPAEERLPGEKVLWITLSKIHSGSNIRQLVYTFWPDGSNRSFWDFEWPYNIADCKEIYEDRNLGLAYE